ncbi:uncharacterized protein LOC129894714 [Solanum dulcamara]|uniref:uncharacterized protein LOC129894714 n=1 Tax=Solanum dulcamara TaxID=45834 RepID=UPI002484FC19|nr:uncharacterized protein LOC129894714 [Solanum dulcamara]
MTAKTVCDVAVPLTANIISSIQKPPAEGIFELKQNMVELLHSNGQFTGLPHEDPQVHIQNFLDISDTYTPNGVSPDYVRLTLFPFSLLEEAKRWLKSEPPNSITSWNDLACGQTLEKIYDEIYTLLNCISQGNPKWNGGNSRPVVQKQAGMLEVDVVTTLTA